VTEKTLVKNVKTLEDRIAEAIRGPAIAFLTKVAAPWTKGGAAAGRARSGCRPCSAVDPSFYALTRR